ncbi:hypothetical protein SAMN05216325_10421 [Nitrosomonas marina]|uniref:Uncharacterized protein n=2 Tax=Nitrosomonas marina TaxID=917 RepID=A0A1H8C5R0_9PROT|nr:hypothetical protein SAMN05216325_10421 [Nitrosomonas marina]
MSDRIVSVKITMEEGNLILTALAECPFKTVFELIGKLNQQAHHQFAEATDKTAQKPFMFTEQELLLTIKALGKLPYEHVHQLLDKLNTEMEHQHRTHNDKAGSVSHSYADR